MTQPNFHSQSGIALVSALLYLGVLTLLVTASLSSSILQSKVSQQTQQEAESFSYAELALQTGEDATLKLDDTGKGSSQHAQYAFQRITGPSSTCGLFYNIHATSHIGGSSTSLSSIFTLPQAGPNPCPDPTIKAYRISWKQTDF